MENYRSRSYKDPRMQIEVYDNNININKTAPTNMQDLRCYSANQAGSSSGPPKMMKKANNKTSLGSASKSWSFNDPELQRKKRVAGYKAYTVEGKMKGSFRKSFRWIKDTCSNVVHGLW